jgi:WD repeat-containing protein 1 (actin-interacting protein 1)
LIFYSFEFKLIQVNIFASLPRTIRGSFTILGSDPKGKNFLYVNGNSVYIRSIDEPYTNVDVYTEHSHAVQVAKYAPSGFYIASGDQAGKVRIWDTTNKEHILKSEYQPLGGCVKDLQWSADSQRIIVGGEGREKFGHVFSADTGTSVGEIMGTSKPINSVDLKPTRPFRAIVASEDNSICYFEGPPFKWKRTLNEHERFVNVVRYAANGERFASGGADGKLVIFDGKTGDKLYELSGDESSSAAHSGSIYSLCWDPHTSKQLLTVSGDKTAKLWDVDEKKLVREFKFGDSLDDQQVGCLWLGKHVLTVSLSGKINYLNVSGAESEPLVLQCIKGHSKSITALEVAAVPGLNAPLIFSASHDGLIIHWHSQTGRMDAVHSSGGVAQHKNQVQSIVYDSFNNYLLSCGLDDTFKCIDPVSLSYVKESKLDSQPQGADASAKGVVAIACVNKLLLVRAKEIIGSLPLSYEATCVSIGKQRNHVAVGGKDNKVHLYEYDESSGKLAEMKTIDERDFITAVRFSPNGDYLALADNAKNVKCYTAVSSYAENITKDLWQHNAGRITCLAWSPDSVHLATASVDTHCFVYRPSKPSEFVQIKNAHPLNPLTACVWLDSSHLITASQDCCLRKWKIQFTK